MVLQQMKGYLEEIRRGDVETAFPLAMDLVDQGVYPVEWVRDELRIGLEKKRYNLFTQLHKEGRSRDECVEGCRELTQALTKIQAGEEASYLGRKIPPPAQDNPFKYKFIGDL